MKNRITGVLVVGGMCSIAVLSTFAFAGSNSVVGYPAEYREWTHVKSMWIGAEHGLADPFAGLHHIYINDVGAPALRAGKRLPDGSVFVFDLLEGDVDGHAVVEGDRKFIGVMERNAKAFAATGGWGFEVFPGDSHTERGVTDGGQGCFACHQARKSTGYVFTTWRP